ncbi:ATP-binding protein [Cryobacterium sp.]|jgi:two-component system phosphate regulon sensor histidine kinase PhoR|uniref:sensor histidine kinase n=1 Tax=Cryobacterium sp. TaxID=1926290 RepID=UPI00262A0F8D|nr:ATP-binding protein [Cryobacterium sp.]MCU1445733.1 putative signal transduction histidine kinase [Cryobacterium sp.]
MEHMSRMPRVGVRERVERSVFLSQLLLAAATLLLVAVSVVTRPTMLADPLYFLGVMLIFGSTGLAAAVPWRRFPKVYIVVLPLLDIVGLAAARIAEPNLGVSFLLVFPVIWMSTHFGQAGATGSVIFAAVLLWGGLPMRFLTDPNNATGYVTSQAPLLAVVTIMLAFVASVTYTSTRRGAAQRVLLTQQAGLFETALQRSRRQEQTLDEIFNTVDFGVVGYDRDAKVNFMNRAQRLLLSRYGVSTGIELADIIYREDGVTPFDGPDRPYQRAMRGETVDRVTVWVGTPGQQQTAVLVSSRPIRDHNDSYDGGVLVTRDVTAEVRAVKARDDLVASVSHELRTPLTSILGYLELALDDDRVDPDTRRMLEIASKNADRLLEIVSGLLTAASASNEGLTLALESCDMAAILTEAVESAEPLASQRNIRFELGDLPETLIVADGFRLRQVIDNVLSNAIKYNVDSGKVSVSLQERECGVEVRVTDTGRGMSEDEQGNLFDRFYRADSVRGSSVHGTGLGLNISREIMREHGGDLRLESIKGKGTTAIATLPVNRG